MDPLSNAVASLSALVDPNIGYALENINKVWMSIFTLVLNLLFKVVFGCISDCIKEHITSTQDFTAHKIGEIVQMLRASIKKETLESYIVSNDVESQITNVEDSLLIIIATVFKYKNSNCLYETISNEEKKVFLQSLVNLTNHNKKDNSTMSGKMLSNLRSVVLKFKNENSGFSNALHTIQQQHNIVPEEKDLIEHVKKTITVLSFLPFDKDMYAASIPILFPRREEVDDVRIEINNAA